VTQNVSLQAKIQPQTDPPLTLLDHASRGLSAIAELLVCYTYVLLIIEKMVRFKSARKEQLSQPTVRPTSGSGCRGKVTSILYIDYYE